MTQNSLIFIWRPRNGGYFFGFDFFSSVGEDNKHKIE
jgi:hypothetical protein